jgi:phenylalanine-4-hydroxylase
MQATEATIDAAIFTTQEWHRYDAGHHDVWRILYARRMAELERTGSRIFLDGAELIGLRPDCVPDLADVNARLFPRTGWQAVPVTGFIPADQFFACLAARRFPTTITLRPRDQLDYLPEPDIFHDVFGHVPLHAHAMFADFLQTFGAVAARARTEEQMRAMARVFWFTVEFGLVRESGAVKVYGSGLISSHGDAANALGPACERRPFVLDDVIAQHVEIDRLQDVLFVVEDFGQLFDAVSEMERRLGG